MAEVHGYTAERMLEVENSTVVSARIEGDNLILTTRGSVDINLGQVKLRDSDIAAFIQSPSSQTNSKILQVIDAKTKTAVPPLVTEALAADNTVANAAASAVEGALEDVEVVHGDNFYNDEVAFAITDDEDRRSWMEINHNGGPTAYSVEKLKEGLNLDVLEVVDRPGIFFTDEQGRSMTDLVFDPDGSFTKEASERIVNRGSGSFRPTGRKASRWYAFGDSITAADWAKYAMAHTGVYFSHRGIGGQSPNDIAVRQGGVSIYFQLSGASIIAGAGGTTNLVKLAPTTGFRSYADGPIWSWGGNLGPVAGTLYHNLGTDQWYFVSSSGTSSHTPPGGKTVFVCTADDMCRGHGLVAFVGRNQPNADLIIRATKAMVDHLEYGRPFLIVGVTANQNSVSDLNSIKGVNRLVAEQWAPEDYFDLQTAMASIDTLTRVGLTPTAQDLIDVESGFIPRQLVTDGVHFTDKGYEAMGQIIGEALVERGKI